jgi:hypothetical protein
MKPMARRCIVLLIGLMLVGCSVVEGFFQDTAFQAEMTTYRNESYNYELDYPAGWFVEEAASVTMLTSFELGSLPGSENIPPEHTKIDIYSITYQPSSFEHFIINQLATLDCIIGDPIPFAFDLGGQAVEITTYSDMGGPHLITYAEIQGQYFRIVAFSNLTPVQDIVRSLRLISPPEEYEDQGIFDGVPVPTPDADCYIP